MTECGRAVWAVVRQKLPASVGTSVSCARCKWWRGAKRAACHPVPPSRYVWRNMLFRNLGAGLSSDLVREATVATYAEWARRYGELPEERLRTEIGVRSVRSTNPGCCYLKAGWERGPTKRGKLFLFAPAPTHV